MAFRSVLIANRGEIALRTIRGCRALGLRVIAAYSEADADAPYLELADEAVCIGPASPAASYLSHGALLRAARFTGAEAVHPGYGFLSENARFAEMVVAAGLAFIGPSARVIRLMGDKIRAKAAMREAGVPCVPGSDGALPPDFAACARMVESVGYPVLVKASGGGGGRGMRIVRDPAELPEALAVTREEALRAFGNADIYAERYLERPRHIEIQVICDRFGNGVWLGARDCSIQRRHQKLIEETPPPGIAPHQIAELGAKCVAACSAVGYEGLGTFEFLFDGRSFAFIEMNTRIQVEHPITEETTGIDMVQHQVRVARGERLAFAQGDIAASGHSMECRLNAETPFEGQPRPGRIDRWRPPGGPGIRVDTYAADGVTVSPHYDSLVAKLIATGRTRAESIERMRHALAELHVEGVELNTRLHQRIMEDDDFKRGQVDIHYLQNRAADFAG